MTAEQRNSRQVRRRIREERAYWTRTVDIHARILPDGTVDAFGFMAKPHRAEAMRRRTAR